MPNSTEGGPTSKQHTEMMEMLGRLCHELSELRRELKPELQRTETFRRKCDEKQAILKKTRGCRL